MKRKAVISHVSLLSESDAAEPSLSSQKKQSSGLKYYAVETTGGKAAVHCSALKAVVDGTEVSKFSNAEVIAHELNKGRAIDDVKYLIALMESGQQS